MTDLSLDKIKNMLDAHNDGVYRLEARDNLGEIVGWLVDELEAAKSLEWESNYDWKDFRGVPMSEIKVGMKLKHTTAPTDPVITVTEITDKGFKYTQEKRYVRWGGTAGWVEGGEHFGVEGYSYCTEVEAT